MIGTGRMLRVAAAVLLSGVSAGQAALAQEEYDSPRSGNSPCIVLDEYIIDRVPGQGGEMTYRARATLGNICGRSMEVRFCFILAEATDAGDRICHSGTVRPGSQTSVETEVVPSRIVDREIVWRFQE